MGTSVTIFRINAVTTEDNASLVVGNTSLADLDRVNARPGDMV